jgi:hypothetical protein
MKADVRRPCGGEIPHETVYGAHHEMNVNWRSNTMVAQCLANQRPNGQIRHVMIIHDVEMNDVRISGKYGTNLITESREIGRQYGRGNQKITHGNLLWSAMRGMLARHLMPRCALIVSYAERISRVRSFATSIIESGNPRATSLSG